MGFFRWLFGRGSVDGPNYRRVLGGTEVRARLYEGRTRMDIVGESQYQGALRKIVGGPRPDGVHAEAIALLLPEPANRYDRNAVGVWIDGLQVGYLSRENAEVLQPPLKRLQSQEKRSFSCRAHILGGWDMDRGGSASFGVRLYFDPSDLKVDPDDLDLPWEEEETNTGVTRPVRSAAGIVEGRHYTQYVEEIKRLRRESRELEAESLLARLLDAVEAEARDESCGVAPWYYEQLAIIYRRRKDFHAEVDVLTRFSEMPHAPGASTPALLDRLSKALDLLARERAKGNEN